MNEAMIQQVKNLFPGANLDEAVSKANQALAGKTPNDASSILKSVGVTESGINNIYNKYGNNMKARALLAMVGTSPDNLKHPSAVEPKQKVLQPVYFNENNTDSNTADVVAEYEDIFPALREYEAAKEAHVLGKSGDVVIDKTRDMLKEVIEFLRTVHKNADTQEERNLIKKAFGIIHSIG